MKILPAALALVVGAAGCGKSSSSASSTQGVEIVIACGAVGQESRRCKEAAQAWAQKTGNRIKTVSTSTASSEALALYQQLLAAGADDIDVLRNDVIWPGILGS